MHEIKGEYQGDSPTSYIFPLYIVSESFCFKMPDHSWIASKLTNAELAKAPELEE